MRTKEVRLSQEEKQRLDEYRDEEYDEAVPYGWIVGKLLDEVEEE